MITIVEDPTGADPLEANLASAAPAKPSLSDIARRWLCIAQLLAILATAVILLLDIEYLLGTFPVCALLGLVFAFSVRRLGSWAAFVYGMSTPVVVVASGLMIAYGEWGPPAAEIPILSVWWLYTLAAVVGFFLVYRRVHEWRSAEHPLHRRTWQFQIKFLLIQTLILSVLLAMVKSFVGGGHDPFLMFAAVSAGIIFVCGLVTAAFLAELRADARPTEVASSDNPSMS